MLAVRGGHVPFHNHHDMHDIINATTISEAPWNHFTLKYEGPLHDSVSQENAPAWMMEEHKIWFCDPVTQLESLLSNPDLKDEFNYTLYQEHTTDGSHHFHDFMSGNWAWQWAVSYYILYLCFSTLTNIYHLGYHYKRSSWGFRHISCHSILGSSKTTVSVATVHICNWPLYLLIGNTHNNVHHGHQNSLVLLGFLAIPNSMLFIFNPFTYLLLSCLANNESCNDINYQKFCCQLLHSSLQKIPLQVTHFDHLLDGT